MNLGISSYTYGWAVAAGQLTAHDLIQRAAAFDVSVLQLADNLPPETFAPDAIDAIADHARALGIRVELGARGCKPECLRRAIGVARRLDVRILRTVMDSEGDRPCESLVVERLRGILPDLAAAGVTLAIENHDRFRAASLVRILEACGSAEVGICLDTANSLGVPEGPEHVVNTLGPHVVNLHVKDFAVQRVPYLQGFTIEGRPAGQGMLDIPWLLSRLRAFGRDAISAIAELWVPPEPDAQATIEKESRWAEQSVAFLKALLSESPDTKGPLHA